MRRVGIAVAATALAALSAWTLAAEPPAAKQTVAYQGVLEMNGAPVSVTTDFTFTLTDGNDAGNTWTEAHPGVTVAAGRFSVKLGSVDAGGVPDWAFQTTALDLQIGVGSGPLLPNKQRIQAVPYSVTSTHAATADDADRAALAGTFVVPSLSATFIETAKVGRILELRMVISSGSNPNFGSGGVWNPDPAKAYVILRSDVIDGGDTIQLERFGGGAYYSYIHQTNGNVYISSNAGAIDGKEVRVMLMEITP